MQCSTLRADLLVSVVIVVSLRGYLYIYIYSFVRVRSAVNMSELTARR